jgi:hypothetical protein
MSFVRGVIAPETAVEMTFVFQLKLMLVSLYGLKTRPAGGFPPPLLEPLPELEPLELLEPPLELPELELEPPLELPELELLELLAPPGHVVPPGSQPVPQLTVWQW